MRDAHDAEPVVAGALAQADAFADARGEDLAAAAGDGGEAGGLESADDLAHVRVEEALELDELGRAERVDVDRGEILADVAEQALVPLDRQAVVHPALHQ